MDAAQRAVSELFGRVSPGAAEEFERNLNSQTTAMRLARASMADELATLLHKHRDAIAPAAMLDLAALARSGAE